MSAQAQRENLQIIIRVTNVRVYYVSGPRTHTTNMQHTDTYWASLALSGIHRTRMATGHTAADDGV